MCQREPIISISGMRGVVGRQLRPEDVVRYVAAACMFLREGPVVVGRDSRPSGRIFWHAVVAALQACGRQVIDVGIVPTPTVGVVIRRLEAAGGVQISGSHNPPDQNGVKLLDHEGKMLPPDVATQVQTAFRTEGRSWADRHPSYAGVNAAWMAPLFHVREVIQVVDADLIRRQSYRVFVDANGGAGGLLAKWLLEELGCKVVGVALLPDGQFRHPPEPLAENLTGVCQQVAAAEVDIAFCLDPDADRLAIIDSRGNYLGEEYTLSLCLRHVLSQRPGPVVINCATSMMNERIASSYGVPCIRVPVGEANVVRGMQQHGAIFGGEGNGGPIDPRVGWIRDSLVGMALVLEAMAAERTSVGELAATLPKFVMRKLKVPMPAGGLDCVFHQLAATFPDAHADRTDGLRLSWEDRWLLCRASNTEPIVRVLVEGPSEQDVDQLCQKAIEALTFSQ